MPTHIFYNSLTQIRDEDNFKYDFYVSKSPSDGSQLTTTGPFFRLKTDTTGLESRLALVISRINFLGMVIKYLL